MVVLGPGDLYSSIIPSLLVNGFNKALTSSRAKLAYVVNLMTKKGETDGYKASDFIGVVENYLGASKKKLSHVIVNNKLNSTKSKIASWYKKYGSVIVTNDLMGKQHPYKIISGNFSDTTTFYRHSPAKLAKAIISIH